MSRVLFKLPIGLSSRWTATKACNALPSTTQAFCSLRMQPRLAATKLSSKLARPHVAPRPGANLHSHLQAPLRVRFSSSSTSDKMREAAQKVKQKASQGKEQAQTLGQRLKTLSKQYGWVALGVYMGLSALDFPFCFLLVRVAGPERIGHLEHVVVSAVSNAIPDSVKGLYHDCKAKLQQSRASRPENGDAEEPNSAVDAEPKGASLGTQLALAYAIHKSLIFIRVPLTAAVLPKVVQILRRWGYKVGSKSVKG
ncbi:hypothetical protein BROUX41_000270 [Berkeleyomyces rouxiae]|uniref:uncharacterized protein n=1 Tax=Berkeleyomyces rouxiae TaxID=2035830 RepID=UPI003B7C947B